MRKRLTKAERQKVYEKCGGHCAYCGRELEYRQMNVDHAIPLRSCGKDELENMLLACRSCNNYKSSMSIEELREMIEKMPDTLMRDNTTYRNAVRFGVVVPNKMPIKFYFEKILEYGNDVTEKFLIRLETEELNQQN